jgi:hypothetical protein
MKSKKNLYNSKKENVFASLTFHDSFIKGDTLISRVRGKITEKDIALRMISQILLRFDITVKDFQDYATRQLIREVDEQRFNRKVKWTKDKKGRIISPFATKKNIGHF